MTVCGVTVCPFSRHKGNQRPKCLKNKAQMHLSRNCPFSNKTNLHLELPGLFKIITRMTLLFLNYLEDYSYSYQGSSELTCNTVTVPCSSSRMQLQERIPLENFTE